MALDIANLFNNVLPEVMAAHPEIAKELNMVFKMNIGDTSWILNFTAPPGRSHAYTNESANCTITMRTDVFEELMEDPLNKGMFLALSGKMKVSNNDMRTRKLLKLFDFAKS
jgi:hypothetical protein